MLFSPIALKDIFAMLNIRAWNIIYLHQSDFAWVAFCENETLAKVSEFTVYEPMYHYVYILSIVRDK